MSLRSVSFLVPLKLNCHDDKGNSNETEMVSDYQEASFSEADEPPTNEFESTISGHEVPIHLGIDSPASGPNESPLTQPAPMQLSGLEETHRNESADILQRDSQSPSQHSDAPPDEHIMQQQPRRATTRQRQLLQELLQQDLL